jgi:hypothetical protein
MNSTRNEKPKIPPSTVVESDHLFTGMRKIVKPAMHISA